MYIFMNSEHHNFNQLLNNAKNQKMKNNSNIIIIVITMIQMVGSGSYAT